MSKAFNLSTFQCVTRIDSETLFSIHLWLYTCIGVSMPCVYATYILCYLIFCPFLCFRWCYSYFSWQSTTTGDHRPCINSISIFQIFYRFRSRNWFLLLLYTSKNGISNCIRMEHTKTERSQSHLVEMFDFDSHAFDVYVSIEPYIMVFSCHKNFELSINL